MRKPLFIARQARRPAGLIGHIVARVMAIETAPENRHTLDLLGLSSGDRVLDVGCGHGRTLYTAAKGVGDITLTGLDCSDVMLQVARRRNRRFIASRRVTIDRGDSLSLPYEDGAFNKVFSVHTIYFWARPEPHLKEICRVLAPFGRFVLGFRPGDDAAFAAQVPAAVYHMRRAADIETMVADSGFDEVHTTSHRIGARAMTWIVARKGTARPDACRAV